MVKSDIGTTFNSGVSITPNYSSTNFSLLFFFFLPFLNYSMRQSFISTEIKTYVLPPKPHSLVYFEGTLFYQPIVDFPFEHPNIFKKNILNQKQYGGVTW